VEVFEEIYITQHTTHLVFQVPKLAEKGNIHPPRMKAPQRHRQGIPGEQGGPSIQDPQSLMLKICDNLKGQAVFDRIAPLFGYIKLWRDRAVEALARSNSQCLSSSAIYI
jgi:hypothetical protein